MLLHYCINTNNVGFAELGQGRTLLYCTLSANVTMNIGPRTKIFDHEWFLVAAVICLTLQRYCMKNNVMINTGTETVQMKGIRNRHIERLTSEIIKNACSLCQ